MPRIQRFSASLLLAASFAVGGCFFDTSGAPADVDTETETDTGDAGADAGIDGLGEPCTETGGECAGYEADFCLYDPTGASEGGCTVTGCLESGCPSGYTCCDCTDATYFFVDLCAPDEYASMLPMAGCSCE
jgi:hypothetical protein